MIFNNFLDFQK